MYAQIIYENVEVDKLPQLTKNDFGQRLTFYIRSDDGSQVDLRTCFEQWFTLTYINRKDKILLRGECKVNVDKSSITYNIPPGVLIDSGSFLATLELICNFDKDITSREIFHLGYMDIVEE